MPKRIQRRHLASVLRRRTPALVVLIGPPAAGKSTLAAELADECAGRVIVLSLDAARAALSPNGDESDQAVTPQAVARLHADLDRELAVGAAVAVDATNAAPEHRRALLDIAGRRQAYAIAVVVLPGLETVLARNATRSPVIEPCGWARQVPTHIVRAMHKAITEDLPWLPAEGWQEVHCLPPCRRPGETLHGGRPLTEGHVMTPESELLIKEANGWGLHVPGEAVDYPVRWEPRHARDHLPWVVVGTEFRFSHEIIVATPPPSTHNMVCRTCLHPLSHSRGRWLAIDGMCESCAVADLAADISDF